VEPVIVAGPGRHSGPHLNAATGHNPIVAPYHHPLAEDVATVDLLSGGRLDIIVGTGSIRSEFDTFAIDPSERWGRTLEVMGRSFAEDQFDHDGRYFQVPRHPGGD
jgi:alkanesulfonate monooxygenase SsuD/methylene tetrahydromethanopterin reductase-like flavin-dependent oxidoreductase (luciferase family)